MKWKNPKEELPPQNKLVLAVTNYGDLHLAYYDGHNYGNSPRFIDFYRDSIIGKHSKYGDEEILLWSEISRPKLEFEGRDLSDCKFMCGCRYPDKFKLTVEIIAMIFGKTEQEIHEYDIRLVRESCLVMNDFDFFCCEQCYKNKLLEMYDARERT